MKKRIVVLSIAVMPIPLHLNDRNTSNKREQSRMFSVYLNNRRTNC